MQNKSMRILSALMLVLAFAGVSVSAAPVSSEGTTQKLDIYVSESKIIYLNKAVEDVTSSNPDVVTVDRVRGMESQISVSGSAVGDSTVTVRMGNETRIYQIKVSPMPQRIYINIPESKYLSFKNRVEDFNLSVAGVVRVLQPTDKELLLEALPLSPNGTRTTLTVFSKGEIYRYYISTFDNRGADLMEIQNAFTTRGYKYLTIKFSRDEATLGGTVSTQEELDDAVRIVKQFTPYVVIKADVGNYVVQSEESEDERLIANNILRISQVKGLTVRVKFAQPQERTSSVFTRVVGKPALSTSVTDNQTRLTTNSTDLPKDDGPVNKVPIEGTLETVSTSQDKALPEKIFLFGELNDDLDEAKAIRVARTFCPFVVSMVTVKDPIQVRLKTRILTVDLNKVKNTGINWYSGTNTNSYPSVGGGLTYQISNRPAGMQDVIMALRTDVQFTLNLGENNDFIKQVQAIDLMLTNGQPSSLFRGEDIPYPAIRSVDSNGNVTTSASFVSTGLWVLIVPLNFERGSQQAGEQLSLVDNDGKTIIGSLSKYFQLNKSIGSQPTPPVIDESMKYVDENGLIGMSVFVNVSALVALDSIGPDITAPRTADKRSMARAHMREGQSLVIGGILDDQLQKTIKSVPGFNKIPIFGFLFDSTNKTSSTSEMVLTFTPEIVRLNGSPAKRMPKPHLPEVQDLMEQQKMVTTAKPVRYDARRVDLRSDTLSQPKISTDAPKPAAQPPVVIPTETEVAKPVPVPLFQTPDLTPPPPVEVAKIPVKDTADVPPPTPPPAPVTPPLVEVVVPPQAEPKIDTAPPRVNNGPTNPPEIPPTLP